MQTIDRRRFNSGLFFGFGFNGCVQLPNGDPDLIIAGLRWSEDDGATWHTGPIQAGSSVWFEAEVRNQGPGPTPKGVTTGVAFLVNDETVSWSDDYTTSIPAGTTVGLRANRGKEADGYWNNVTAGTYTLLVRVNHVLDGGDRYPEVSKDDNIIQTTLTVSSPTGFLAQQADELVDSIGVNTHFSRTTYKNNYISGSNLKERLGALGVRYIRDGVQANDAVYTGILNDLHASHGIKFLLITNIEGNQTADTAYSWIQNEIGFEKIYAMEGLNEPAVFHGGKYLERAYGTQAALWDRFRVNGVPKAQALPIYACSPTSIEEAKTHHDYAVCHGRPYATIADFGNIHPYPNARNPETDGWGNRNPEGDYRYGALGYSMQGIGEALMQAGVAMSATENGYRYVFPYTGGQRSVPDDVGAIYLVRMSLHLFAHRLPSGASIRKNFLYIFWDDENAGFNVLGPDGEITLAYTALQNLINLLADPGPSFVPGPLDYELSGSLADVETVLFQKRNGVFYLALWIGKSMWAPDEAFPINVASQSVTVTFNIGVASVDRVLPNEATTWVPLPLTNDQVAISVESRVVILRVVPLSASVVSAVSGPSTGR